MVSTKVRGHKAFAPYKICAREDASINGDIYFFSGAACKKGHYALRSVKGNCCLGCNWEACKRYEKEIRPDFVSTEKTRESSRKNMKKIREADPEKSRKVVRENLTSWRKNNIPKIRAWSAGQKYWYKIATPKWLSKEHKKEIVGFYWERKVLSEVTGIQFHVDHIIPLKGKIVCGLNVPWNLRTLEWKENIVKKNKFEGYFTCG